jgi:acyl-homoserine-lactone acylase
MQHAEISKARYQQISPKMRGVIESYQNGIKQFMKEHPEQVPAWAQQIQPWDAVALGRYIIWNWPMGEAAEDLKRAGVAFGPIPYRGSNEMLIAPKRTTMNAAIAIIDPHVQWYDQMRFYEVRVYTPEYNVSGVSILGAPLPTLGHSRFCSVAMTTGGPDTSDIFEEEVNPANPDQYRYDGQWRDFTVQKLLIGVKVGDKVEQRPLTISFSHHGPIVAQKNGKAYAMARRYLLCSKWPRADPRQGGRPWKTDTRQHVRHGVEGNSPDVGPGADRKSAVRLDAELQLLSGGDDEPGPAALRAICGEPAHLQ